MKTLLLLLFTITLAYAQDTKQPQAQPQQPEWLKYTIPGEAHKNLENIVGDFKYHMVMWKDPLAQPETSDGESENEWILGKRYVKQEFEGKFNNEKFEGLGMTGYDNMRNEFQTIWMDSMSTAMWYTAGTNLPNAKVIKQEGRGSNPMKGSRDSWFRTELRIKDKNEHTFIMYAKSASGKEYRTMEITYTRKK